jgi:glyoxylase-like metal-dependent hydrolase (beta-lactamase superfamily II)
MPSPAVPGPLRADGSWQQLPGGDGIQILPFFGKPDIMSSNAFVIRTAGEIMMIDSGNDRERLDRILSSIAESGNAGPVICLLTHCHIDHCLPLISEIGRMGRSWILAIQEDGAAALGRADERLTLAELFRVGISARHVEVSLLTEEDRASGGIRFIRLSTGQEIMVRTGHEAGLLVQELALDEATVRLYHTPGHSPDSICILLGRSLFIGDLLFAANPGVAGLPGFSSEDLLLSVRGIISLLESGTVDLCLSGHGNPLPAGAALEAFQNLSTQVQELGEVRCFDLECVSESRDLAMALLDESERLFTIIGGRLLSLSHILSELGEDAEAKRYHGLLDIDRIDRLLTEFADFSEEFRDGKKLDVQLVLKTVQVLSRIDAVFRQDALCSVIDLPVVRRTARILTDFLNTMMGYQVAEGLIPVDLAVLVPGVIRDAQHNPVADEALIDAADDEEEFRVALVARLAHLPILSRVRFDVTAEPGVGEVRTDPERLGDMLLGLFEEWAASGVSGITIRIFRRDGRIGIRVTGTGSPDRTDETIVPDLHRGRFAMCGGSLIAEECDRHRLTIEFPATEVV